MRLDLTLLLTLIALIISIYTILPEYKKSRIKYSIGKFEKIFILIVGISTLILYAVSMWIDYNSSNLFLTIKKVSLPFEYILEGLYLIILVILFLFVLNKFYKKVPVIKNRSDFLVELEERIQKQDYFTSIKIIKENLKCISIKDKNSFSNKIKQIMIRDNFLKNLSKIDPYFCIDVLKEKFDDYFKEKFFEKYIKILLEDNESMIYEEVKNNQNLDKGRRYYLHNDNFLLTALFKDINNAEKLKVWKPIGEFAIGILNAQQIKKEDSYNNFDELFSEYSHYPKIYSNGLFVAIRLFDIMVLEAMYQKKNWHMWLYYYDHITRYICRNYHLGKYADLEEENPNSYSYFLSEMVLNLIKWIWESDDYCKGYSPKSITAEHDNGDIVKSSIICLSLVHKEIIDSENIPHKFKEKITHQIYRLYFDLVLSENNNSQSYSEVLLLCLKERIKNYQKKDKNYQTFLINSLNSLDKVPIQFKPKGSNKIKEFENNIREV